MVSVGILGASGYAGAKLVSLLSCHPEVQLTWLGSHRFVGKKFSDLYPAMLGLCDMPFREDSVPEASLLCDVLFLALPAGIAGTEVNETVLRRCVVIDLGADFRLHDGSTYETWYHLPSPSSSLLQEAVYGLPELHREAIRHARLIANPGCYTTTSILSLKPVIPFVDQKSIIIDAASGVSGAGRSEKTASLFCECNESMKAYGVGNHRHTPEIEQELGFGVMVQFTPHLAPMTSGILATCTANLKDGVTEEMVDEAYHKFYDGEKCIRLYPSASAVESRFVLGSNSVAIGWTIDERTGRVIVCGALDNLYKGAAGQAVQNMNIRLSFPETEGLSLCNL
jgi:N-acetyl-gamma-glutamyl-phosphate reductase